MKRSGVVLMPARPKSIGGMCPTIWAERLFSDRPCLASACPRALVLDGFRSCSIFYQNLNGKGYEGGLFWG